MTDGPITKAVTMEFAKATGDLLINVRKCARCGGDHDRVGFKPFTNPPRRFSHWAHCPKSGEPILMRLVETESE